MVSNPITKDCSFVCLTFVLLCIDYADQAIAVSSAWRSELQKIWIWYATFGSNMYFPRLRCYIEGGQVYLFLFDELGKLSVELQLIQS